MKLLVLEKDDKITSIFQKLFQEKQYEVDFVKSEFECIDKIDANYDYVILEKPTYLADGKGIEEKIRNSKPHQKVFFLEPYMNLIEEGDWLKDSKEIIEKPFAMLTLISKIEISQNAISNRFGP
jgi:DNA-binding response OmpR family regulator